MKSICSRDFKTVISFNMLGGTRAPFIALSHSVRVLFSAVVPLAIASLISYCSIISSLCSTPCGSIIIFLHSQLLKYQAAAQQGTSPRGQLRLIVKMGSVLTLLNGLPYGPSVPFVKHSVRIRSPPWTLSVLSPGTQATSLRYWSILDTGNAPCLPSFFTQPVSSHDSQM